MNNLKFRYWDKTTNAMYIADSIEIKDKRIGTYIDNEYMSCDFDDVIIMQSTGLKDKNGKDIFEGDIIQRQIKDGTFFAKKYIVPNISNIIYQFPIDKISFDLSEHKTIFYDIKVGNIYENSELFNS